MFLGFIFTSNELHSSHNTLSELFSHALLTDHWYFPSSLTPSSTISLTPNAVDPLLHTSLSSIHNSTSAKDPPTMSFLFQLSLFLSPTTSPHLRSTLYLSPTTSPHLRPTLYKSWSTSPQTHLAKIHPQTHKQPILWPTFSDPIYIYIYLFICLFIYLII